MVMQHAHTPPSTSWRWQVLLSSLVVLLVMSGAPGTAWGRVHVGIVIPFGLFWGPYVVPAAPPPVVITSPPVVYAPPAPQASRPPAAASSWYYCANPSGYYPYVQQCPGGWRVVAPTPPDLTPSSAPQPRT